MLIRLTRVMKQDKMAKSRSKSVKKGVKLKGGMIILLIIAFFVLLFLISAFTNAITNKILIVPIKGAISTSDSGFLIFGQEANVPFILSCLEKAEKDSSVKAVMLEINSPGGTVIGSSNVADKVKEVKKHKPVVAFINEVGASGAYWIASTADKIIAEPFSITGSIGVTSSYLEYAGLLSRYNITYQRLVTGEFKDIATPYKELTELEKNVLLKKLNIIHEEFVNVVGENRGLTESQKRQVGNGLFYLGKEALDLGLVDELGNKKKAEQVARDLADAEDLKIVKCEKRESFIPFFRASSTFAYYLGKGIGSEFTKAPSYMLPIIS